MLTLTDSLILARHDVAATFRGRKGLALAILLFLLAAAPALVRFLGQHSDQAAALQRAHSAAMVRLYDRDIARALLDCPAVLVVAAIATFFFQPLFVLLAGADRLAGDIDTGSIRYWTVRAPRTGVLLGKTLGLWAVVSLLSAGVLLSMTVLAVIDVPRDWLWTLGWSGRILVYSAASALVYASLCTLLGVLLARPRLVLVVGMGVLFVMRIGRTALENHGAPKLALLLPGALDHLFLSPGAAPKLTAVAVTAVWSATLLGAAAVLFRRRSL